jgi:hypothetical protein
MCVLNRCDIDGCAVRLRSHDKIEYHRRCHRNEKFLCPECSQETVHWKSLSTHLWRCHVIDMELFACDQCNYKTNRYCIYSGITNLLYRSKLFVGPDNHSASQEIYET